MSIKSFKGLIANATQDTIPLSTNQGKVGYRIVKLQVIGDSPVLENQESVVKIYKVKQTSVDALINFSDNTLLGVGVWSSHSSATNYPEDMTVIFDSEIFNQDIYVTHSSPTPRDCNYYIELEQIKLLPDEVMVATLKDIRNTATV